MMLCIYSKTEKAFSELMCRFSQNKAPHVISDATGFMGTLWLCCCWTPVKLFFLLWSNFIFFCHQPRGTEHETFFIHHISRHMSGFAVLESGKSKAELWKQSKDVYIFGKTIFT